MQLAIVLDGDNTLWDTDSVFQHAHRALLRELAHGGMLDDPDARFESLRELDRILIRKLGLFEYDFRLLALSAANRFGKNMSPADAIRAALVMDVTRISGVVAKAYDAFRRELSEAAPLYQDAKDFLLLLRQRALERNDIARVLFSEGAPARLDRVLYAHRLEELEFFDKIILARKDRKTFELVKEAVVAKCSDRTACEEVSFMMVGDSLARDIKFGNQANFMTVYKPATFHGIERPVEEDEVPDHTISSFVELPSILRDLGLPW